MQTWRSVAEALRAHPRCALVTVAAVQGSAPREAGARMLVMPDGGFHGTIGGGALEWQAIAAARDAMARPAAGARLTRHVLGPDLGQCCGGSVKLLTEVFDRTRIDAVEALAARESRGPFVTLGDIRPDGVQRAVSERPATPAAAALAERDGRIWECFGSSPRTLYLFGAGHVGRALVLALAPLPFRVVWIDAREEAFPRLLPASTRAVCRPDPAAQLAGAATGSFVLVMTHSHALDLEIVDAALRAGRFPYVGLIGSGSKRARFTRRLARAGVAPAALERLVCPIGVAGIRSKHPAQIAAAVAAQLLIRLDEAVPDRAAAPAPQSATAKP